MDGRTSEEEAALKRSVMIETRAGLDRMSMYLVMYLRYR